jgi:hypothetical protein
MAHRVLNRREVSERRTGIPARPHTEEIQGTVRPAAGATSQPKDEAESGLPSSVGLTRFSEAVIRNRQGSGRPITCIIR